jgi:hypothetical protein
VKFMIILLAAMVAALLQIFFAGQDTLSRTGFEVVCPGRWTC